MHEMPRPFPGTPRSIFTVRQFSERHPAFSQVALRRFIYFSLPRRLSQEGRVTDVPANGFDHAIVRVGRRVLIDEQRFFEWLDSQQPRQGGGAA